MPQRIIAEFVQRRTKAGDPYFIGHVPAADGGWVRLMLVFNECRANDAGEAVECWQLRSEEVHTRPSPFETLPSPNRRIRTAKDAQRPGNGRAAP